MRTETYQEKLERKNAELSYDLTEAKQKINELKKVVDDLEKLRKQKNAVIEQLEDDFGRCYVEMKQWEATAAHLEVNLNALTYEL